MIRDTTDPDHRVEQKFHADIWAIASLYSIVERAVSEARDVMYLIKKDDTDTDLLKIVAEDWLDTFGRNLLREAKANASSD